MLPTAEASLELPTFGNIWVIMCRRETKHFKYHKNMWKCEENCQSYNITQKTTKPAKTEAAGLNIAGPWLVKYLVKVGSDCFVPISAVCVVSLHVAETLLPDVVTRHTTHTSKQNHGPKQNITKEIKPTCLIPPRHSWEHSTQLAQHWSRKTCTSLNNMINTGHTGWIDWRGTYFLVAPCLCAGTPRGSDGGGTGRSHDLCHHSPAWDIGFPSCPHVKHLLIESRVEVTKSCSAKYICSQWQC